MQLNILERILAVAVTPIQKAKVYMALIAARFDYNPGMSAYLSIEMWKKTEAEINELYSIVEQNPDITISEGVEEEDDEVLLDANGDVKPAAAGTSVADAEDDNDAKKALRGSLVSYIHRLDDEFTKSLQNCDPHIMEYVERLKDEVSLYALVLRAEMYAAKIGDTAAVALLKMTELEHIYHKVG